MWLYQQLQYLHVAGRSPISPLACSPSCSPIGFLRRRAAGKPRHRRLNRTPIALPIRAWPVGTDGTLPADTRVRRTAVLPDPTRVRIEESLMQTPVLLLAARHEQPRRPVIAEARPVIRTCRNEYFIHAHIYTPPSMFTHSRPILSATAAQPFPAFW
jgi:hypothetical protein